MTADGVMWSNQVRNSKGTETHHFQLRRCRLSSLKLWLPWQRRKRGWASACWMQECRNAFWAAISLNLPSIRKSQCVRETFFFGRHTFWRHICQKLAKQWLRIVYIHLMGAVTLGNTNHPNIYMDTTFLPPHLRCAVCPVRLSDRFRALTQM